MEEVKKRHTFLSMGTPLPVFIDTIGYNPREEDFARPEGYPYYHWLQTVKGEGIFTFNGDDYLLTPGKGILLTPYTPHSYYAKTREWSTLYLTFGGSVVTSILNALEINFSSLYVDTKKLPFSKKVEEMLARVEKETELARLDSSADLYSFLIMLKKFGRHQGQSSLSQNYEKLRPIIQWLDVMYPENIGLREIADYAGMSSQHLSSLFRATFNMSPYAFLINLRIREAKRRLSSGEEVLLKDIAHDVGFNDVSHFIATFKRIEGVTPKKYRSFYDRS
ncbi:AraC family transcriptional regulator [Pullulanibacillus sp. KACC 23026]|uniref:AraC family transcriptional regulator n=1 Tax=Pullulanibacillus sp. KACC 23026 TaxID=3028315 RepID=UPI0023AEC4F8|nr:AraC family transcriptional regulator [Pullulanibacillus sp. KACC 23026]WEG12433.1 AraC family transcriptional regulator [Pullulanibacillus sp. KACC 23026]